jgi:hypothetical protein
MIGCTLTEALIYFNDIIPHVFSCRAPLWITPFQWSRQETMDTLIYLRFSLQNLLLETIMFHALIGLYLTISYDASFWVYLLFMFIWWLSCQIISHAERFENKAILLIHFSARYGVVVSLYKFLL